MGLFGRGKKKQAKGSEHLEKFAGGVPSPPAPHADEVPEPLSGGLDPSLPPLPPLEGMGDSPFPKPDELSLPNEESPAPVDAGPELPDLSDLTAPTMQDNPFADAESETVQADENDKPFEQILDELPEEPSPVQEEEPVLSAPIEQEVEPIASEETNTFDELEELGPAVADNSGIVFFSMKDYAEFNNVLNLVEDELESAPSLFSGAKSPFSKQNKAVKSLHQTTDDLRHALHAIRKELFEGR